MLVGGELEKAYVGTVRSPQVDQLVRELVVQARLGGVGDHRDRLGLRRSRTCGLEHSAPRLEQRGVRLGREAGVAVRRTDLGFELAVSPDIEVREDVVELRD